MSSELPVGRENAVKVGPRTWAFKKTPEEKAAFMALSREDRLRELLLKTGINNGRKAPSAEEVEEEVAKWKLRNNAPDPELVEPAVVRLSSSSDCGGSIADELNLRDAELEGNCRGTTNNEERKSSDADITDTLAEIHSEDGCSGCEDTKTYVNDSTDPNG